MNYVAMWRDKFISRSSHDTRINGQVRDLGKMKDELNEFKTLFWFRIVKATLSYVLFRGYCQFYTLCSKKQMSIYKKC